MRMSQRILCWTLIAISTLSLSGNESEGAERGSPVVFFTLPADDSVFQVGEELTYNVSYASFNIGQVRIKLLDSFAKNNRTYFKAAAYIDSYKGVPFVKLHTVYESTIDQDVYSTSFEARQKQDDGWTAVDYRFDYPHHALYIERGAWKSGTIDSRDSLRLDTLSQDGLSLFYLARRYVLTPQKLNIPTVVNEKKGNTIINFTGERSDETIDAVDYPIDLVHFEGEAGFVGVFGLSGSFEGWFSNDAARVPVIAKMKVLLGNVRIELMKWKRAGWEPPRSSAGEQK